MSNFSLCAVLFTACLTIFSGMGRLCAENNSNGIIAEVLPDASAEEKIIIGQTENWNVILSRLNSRITRADLLLKNYFRSGQDEINVYREFNRNIRRQADELAFLLSLCTPEDVFEITLRCQQIDELRDLFRKRYDFLQGIFKSNQQLMQRTDAIRTELENMTTLPKYAEYAREIQNCLRKYQTFRDTAENINARIDELLDTKLAEQLDRLAARAAEARNQTIDNIFFSRQTTFWQLLPGWKVVFIYWYYSFSDTWHGLSFHTIANLTGHFLLFVLPLAVLMLIAGPRWIYPWIIRQSKFPENFRKSRIFPLIGFLLAVAAALYLYQYRAPLSYEAQIHQFSQSIAAGALLLLAITLRVERKNLKRCLLLYMPFILQNFLAVLLFACVAPYQPLMLITVPINLLTAAAALLLLCRDSYPAFDLAMAWTSIAGVAAETILASIGFLYIGFTMMLNGFVVLGMFQITVALSRLILNRTKKDRNQVTNMILFHLVLPLLWIGGIGIVISNISNMYHLRDWLSHWTSADINIHNILEFSIMDLTVITIAVFVVLFVTAFAKALVFKLWKDSADFGKVSSFLTLGTYIVWIVFAVFVLLVCRVEYSSVLVILGGFSVGFGFALKEVLENFISGIILLIGQQVRPGDEIEFDGNEGVVRTVSFRATVIETFDGTIITLPNTNVLSKDFRNCTRKGHRMRHDLTVGVAYGSDLKLVRQTMLDAAAAVREVYSNPPPEVHCIQFSDSSIQFALRFWIHSGEQTRIFSDLREKIVELFAARGIEIPYNRLDVHLDHPEPARQQS